MANTTKPTCVQCRSRHTMVEENSTILETRYHCRRCGTKTTKKTTLGKVRPAASLLGFGLALLGIADLDF